MLGEEVDCCGKQAKKELTPRFKISTSRILEYLSIKCPNMHLATRRFLAYYIMQQGFKLKERLAPIKKPKLYKINRMNSTFLNI